LKEWASGEWGGGIVQLRREVGGQWGGGGIPKKRVVEKKKAKETEGLRGKKTCDAEKWGEKRRALKGH